MILKVFIEEIEKKSKRRNEAKAQENDEKTKKFRDKQDKESAEAEMKLIFNIQKELDK